MAIPCMLPADSNRHCHCRQRKHPTANRAARITLLLLVRAAMPRYSLLLLLGCCCACSLECVAPLECCCQLLFSLIHIKIPASTAQHSMEPNLVLLVYGLVIPAMYSVESKACGLALLMCAVLSMAAHGCSSSLHQCLLLVIVSKLCTAMRLPLKGMRLHDEIFRYNYSHLSLRYHLRVSSSGHA
jgi:hypothetical protein